MEPITNRALRRLVERAAGDGDVLAVILFGSQTRGEAGPRSDIDVCLVLPPRMASREDAARKRLEYLSESDLDLSVFQQLPLHVRSRLLKEGKVLFTRDEDALYAVAARTARSYEHFRHIQRRYLDEVARG
jgi:predicted nucleotidyltransferase